MKKSKLILILIFSFQMSCTDNESRITLFNNTNYNIDSVKISSSGDDYKGGSTIYNLNKNSRSNMILNMDDVPKTDGNYRVEVFYNETKKTKIFGYYSNGSPSNSVYEIVIKNDSIYTKESFD